MCIIPTQLSGLDEISCRAMMGEYILYYRGMIIGGLYDDRFLVKLTPSARAMMPQAGMELPYEGAKEMLLVDNVESREFLTALIDAMYDELPASREKKVSWLCSASNRETPSDGHLFKIAIRSFPGTNGSSQYRAS